VLKADNLPPSCVFVTKSGNLNFLETSGPLWACNGTALYGANVDSGMLDTILHVVLPETYSKQIIRIGREVPKN